MRTLNMNERCISLGSKGSSVTESRKKCKVINLVDKMAGSKNKKNKN